MSYEEEIIRTTTEDYATFYAGYVNRIPPSTIGEVLNADVTLMERLFSIVKDEEGEKAYAEGKWTIKELIQHMMDAERIFCTRAMMISRGEQNPIMGFDHESYVKCSNSNRRSMKSLAREWQLLRSSTQALFSSFDSADFAKSGTASNARITVGALAYLIAGHCLHHLEIMEEKYGVKF